MPSVLIAYATRHGSTGEVAERLAEQLRAAGADVDLSPAGDVVGLGAADVVVLGSPIYAGHWLHDAHRFLKRHADELRTRPFAVFALGPDGSGDVEKAWRTSQAQLDKILKGVEPDDVALFGAVIDPSTLHFPLNRIPAGDWRDWDVIAAFGGRVAALAGLEAVAASSDGLP